MKSALRSFVSLVALGALAAAPHRTCAQTSHVSGHDQREAAKAYLAGARAIKDQNTRAAYESFSQAATLDPSNTDYSEAADVAKAHFVTDLIQQAEKARIQGNVAVVRARLTEAMSVDPTNPLVRQHIGDTLDDNDNTVATDNLSSEIAGAIQLQPSAGTHSFHVRMDAPSLIRVVLSAYGIDPTIDASVVHRSIRFDVDNVGFADAVRMLELATNSFLVPLDPQRALVALDNRANRQQFERQMVETFYLPGLTEQEFVDITNVARNIMGLAHVSTFLTGNSMTVRGTGPRLAVLRRVLNGLMEGRSQVLLEVKVYEISRTRTVNVGVQLPQQFNAFNLNSEIQNVLNSNQSLIQEIISSGLANANDLEAIAAILIASGEVSNSILTQPFALFGGGLTATGLTLGTTTLNLSLNSSESRALDQVQLRLEDQQEGTILTGMHYPIIQSSYSNLTPTSSIAGLTTAGLSSQLTSLGLGSTTGTESTIPQVQYQDLGLTMKVTPAIHRDESVSLKLNLKIDALAGSSVNDIPVLTNRQFTALLDLQNGKSALVTSVLSSQEAKALSGLPGLNEIPGLGAGTDQNVQKSNDELVILITPHVVRMPHATGASQLYAMPVHD